MNDNNSSETDNKISIPPVFDGSHPTQDPVQIEASSVPTDINSNQSSFDNNINGNNNIFKIPIETKSAPQVEQKSNHYNYENPTEVTNQITNDYDEMIVNASPTSDANNYQSSQNNSTLDKDNPLPQINNMEYNDNVLIQAFVGEKYPKFKQPFNVFAFLFGGAYLLYRKMFLYGLLAFVISFIITYFIKIFLLLIVFRVALGFFCNKLYLDFANKKIKKIKYIKSQENFEDLKKICASKGGTSVLQIVLGTLIDLLFTLIVSLIALLIFGVSVFSTLIENVSFIDTSININDFFVIGVPEVFTDKSTEYEYSYVYSKGNGVFDSCTFKLYAVTNANTPQKALNKLTTSTKREYPTKNINNNTWYTATDNKTYYYAIEKDNKIFIAEFNIQSNADSSCNSYHDSIMTMVVSK